MKTLEVGKQYGEYLVLEQITKFKKPTYLIGNIVGNTIDDLYIICPEISTTHAWTADEFLEAAERHAEGL